MRIGKIVISKNCIIDCNIIEGWQPFETMGGRTQCRKKIDAANATVAVTQCYETKSYWIPPKKASPCVQETEMTFQPMSHIFGHRIKENRYGAYAVCLNDALIEALTDIRPLIKGRSNNGN